MKAIIFYSKILQFLNEDKNYIKFYNWNFNLKNYYDGRDYGENLDPLKTLNHNESIYLNNLYEEILKKIVLSLNNHHKMSQKEKDWELVIGPWLRISLFSFYEKWQAVNKISKINNVTILTEKFSLNNLVEDNLENLKERHYEELWNAQIYTIMCHLKKIPVDPELIKNTITKQKLNKSIGKKNIFYFLLYRFIFFFLNFRRLLCRKKFTVLVDIPSAIKVGFNLFRINRGFPLILNKEFYLSSKSKIHSLTRIKPLAKILNTENLSFEDFVMPLLWMSMPKSYLEDFLYISNKAKVKLKKFPIEIIISSNAHWFNDFLKIWIFKKKHLDNQLETGIWQHGGTYGLSKFVSHQEYIETKVFDKFYSWGWGRGKLNIHPFSVLPQILKKNNNQNYLNKDEVLIVLTRVKKYSKGDPWDSEEWNIDYMNLLTNISDLANTKKINISFRLNQSSKASIDLKRYLVKTDYVSINEREPLHKAISNSKLTVITQNSTTLIQSLYANIPTIFFWNEKLNGIREEGRKEFDNLKKIGVFIVNFEEFSSFICKDSSEIQKWWNSEKVQKGVENFLNIYASQEKDFKF